VPTILYYPVQGTPTLHDNGARLGDKNPLLIYLVFWGDYWNTPDGQAKESQFEGSVNGLLYDTTYLDGLRQYGLPYHPYEPNVSGQGFNDHVVVPESWYAFPTQNGVQVPFSDTDVQNVIQAAISRGNLPPPNYYVDPAEYFVVAPPNVWYNDPHSGGYHYDAQPGSTLYDDYGGTVYYGWLGNQGYLDYFTIKLSHELVESMTDPHFALPDTPASPPPNGITLQGVDGVGPEICDNPYSGRVNGYLVNAYWSQNHMQYEVSDGNQQVLQLFGGDVTVNGDQLAPDPLGPGLNDTITIDMNNYGTYQGHTGVTVDLNGDLFALDADQVNAVYVDARAGNNNISVYNAGVPVTITGSGYNNVTIGNAYDGMQGVVSVVNVENYDYGYSDLTVDDRADGYGHSVTMYDGEIFGLGSGTVFYSDYTTGPYGGVLSLYVYGGWGGNTWYVNGDNSYPSALTYLESGSGTAFNHVNVQATTSYLEVDGGAGPQVVVVGTFAPALGGTVQQIDGGLDVVNSGTGGMTTLIIDDSGDATGRAPTLLDGQLTGLAPAYIAWTDYNPVALAGGVISLTVYGGHGGNDWVVGGDSSYAGASTYLESGSGTAFDQVNVQATTSFLQVDGGGDQQVVTIGSFAPITGGDVQSIQGEVEVYNSVSSGTTALKIDDSGDQTGRSATLADGLLSGLGPANITWHDFNYTTGQGGVVSLEVFGGLGGNTWTVVGDDSNGSGFTYLKSGSGTASSTVNIQATTSVLKVDGGGGVQAVTIGSMAPSLGGDVQAIRGGLYVYNSVPGGVTYLTIDDSGDATARTPTLGDGSLSGLAPAEIGWADYNPAGQGGVTVLYVHGGTAGNTWTVIGDNSYGSALTYLYSGSGTASSVVDVLATASLLNVNGLRGQQAVFIGSTTGMGGNVQAILGPVYVYDSHPGGTTTLTIDDSGDTVGRTPDLADGVLTGLAPAQISWLDYLPARVQGVYSLNVHGGSGGNAWTVDGNNAPGSAVTNLQSGSGSGGFNTVAINATTSPLAVDGGANEQAVNVGYTGSVQSVNGSVYVYNSSPNGFSQLYVFDSNDTTGRTATMSNGSLTGLAPAAITWTPTQTTGGVTRLEVIGGTGNNTFYINNTSPFTDYTELRPNPLHTGTGVVHVMATTGALNVYGRGNTDTVTVGSLAPFLGGTLGQIAGPLYVSGAATSLIVDDSGDKSARSVTITGSTVTGLGNPAPITYAVSSLTVDGTAAGSNYNIQGTSAATAVTGGPGNDTFNVGNASGPTGVLDGIQGPLTVNGGAGTNSLAFFDQGQGMGQNYTLTATSLTRGGIAVTTYATLARVTLSTAGSGGSTVADTANPTIPTTVSGNGAGNTLAGPNANDLWTVNGKNAGQVGGVTFSGFSNLTGGAGNDTFAFQTGGRLTGVINGGGGINSLTYAAYTGDVIVDLLMHAATGVGGGVFNVPNVTGSNGNSMLVGDANPNVLIGGTGRNIIIGGAGGDTITGGGGDNILIGGTTSYDTNLTALDAILAEWTNPTLAIGQRTRALKKGIVAGGQTYALNESTVFADNAPDSLIGGPGINWFFVDSDDTINNGAGPGSNDTITHV
jgi:hypothetical protein